MTARQFKLFFMELLSIFSLTSSIQIYTKISRISSNAAEIPLPMENAKISDWTVTLQVLPVLQPNGNYN